MENRSIEKPLYHGYKLYDRSIADRIMNEKKRCDPVSIEKTQMEMFNEDLLNSLLGRVQLDPSTENENAEPPIEELNTGGES